VVQKKEFDEGLKIELFAVTESVIFMERSGGDHTCDTSARVLDGTQQRSQFFTPSFLGVPSNGERVDLRPTHE
jgi:hypothetical protein